jgi:alpha-glucosidase
VRVTCAQGVYVLTVLDPGVVRVRFQPHRRAAALESAPFSYAVSRADADWPSCPFTVQETETAIELTTALLTCRIFKPAGRLTFLDADGEVINADEAGVGHHPDGPIICDKRVQPDERFYGLGERTFGLERRGRRYGTWQTDPRTYRTGQDPIHLCIPVLLGLHAEGRQAYALFFDNTFRGFFDLAAEEAEVASFGAEGGEMRYYFIYGPHPAQVLERYTALTGRMQLPPLWMLGYHQSRWSYHPEARVRKLARDFREVYHVPCDCIHLDIHYMDGYRCFTWDDERFPDPAQKITDLHAQGFKVITIIDPGIKVDPDYWVCRSGLAEDVFCRHPDGETLFKGPVWPGNCYFPDFTSPRVRTWWGALYRVLTDVGVDGIWNDMNEPAIFGLRSTTMPDFVCHEMEGRRADHAEAHNVYGMQMARATTEGLMRLRPNERPVCITRSGWAGVQRYALSWTGDNYSSWEHLWLSMPMVLNLGLSGLSFTGPDIGGYSLFATGELFTRWLQMGIFLPFARAHTFIQSPDQEPWSWGEPYLSVNRRTIELRYRLLPYLYTAFWQCAQRGTPIVRPLFWTHPQDAKTHALDDQFMCGDALLVAPVVEEGSTRRTVYLPAGAWYDFWSDERLRGPAHVEVEAPLERIPLFVRAGAVVPMAPLMQYVGQRPLSPLTLHAYPAPGRGVRSVLYEDDGHTWAFRQGAYRVTHFTLSTSGDPIRELALQRQAEGAYQGACERFEVVVHGVDRPPEEIQIDDAVPSAGPWGPEEEQLRWEAGAFERINGRWT